MAKVSAVMIPWIGNSTEFTLSNPFLPNTAAGREVVKFALPPIPIPIITIEIQKPAIVSVTLNNHAHAYQHPNTISAFFVPSF